MADTSDAGHYDSEYNLGVYELVSTADDLTLLTLRRPTKVQRFIDGLPKPKGSVPLNGLPTWYHLTLDRKLPLPELPPGKITFTRGKIGQNIRKKLHADVAPTFDLSDPYGRNVTNDYDPVHDPHLAFHFARPSVKRTMLRRGYATKECYAICSLRQFNTHRRFLYNEHMDVVAAEIRKINERASDDLTLLRVDRDVERKRRHFLAREAVRERLEKLARINAEEIEKRKAEQLERELNVKRRIERLEKLKEEQRLEHVAKGKEKAAYIKERIRAADELQLKKIVTTIKVWRKNERKRLARVKQRQEEKKMADIQMATEKWEERIESQTRKLDEAEMLLERHRKKMESLAMKRRVKTQVSSYIREMDFHRIRMRNWKRNHRVYSDKLSKTIGLMFEKNQRCEIRMSKEASTKLAVEALKFTNKGPPTDTVLMLGETRKLMDDLTLISPPVLFVLTTAVEQAIIGFTYKRLSETAQYVENYVYHHNMRAVKAALKGSIAPLLAIHNPNMYKRLPKKVEKRSQTETEAPKSYRAGVELKFMTIPEYISPEGYTWPDKLKRCIDRPPTPVASKTCLAEMVFDEKEEDLLDPPFMTQTMPEREQLISLIKTTQKYMMEGVARTTVNGLDVVVNQITLPKLKRYNLTWDEAVSDLTKAVIEDRLNQFTPALREAINYISRCVLLSIKDFYRKQKKIRANMDEIKKHQLQKQIEDMKETIAKQDEEIEKLKSLSKQ